MSVQLHTSGGAPPAAGGGFACQPGFGGAGVGFWGGPVSSVCSEWTLSQCTKALMCLLRKSNYFPPAEDHFVHWGEFDCLMLGFMSMTRANVRTPGRHWSRGEVS